MNIDPILHQEDGWWVWMYGASFMNEGQCYESGAVYLKDSEVDLPGHYMRGSPGERKAELIYTTRADGARIRYRYVNNDDPAIFWQGQELGEDDSALRIKHYESSRFVRSLIAGQSSGPDYSGFDLCPGIGMLLGRSWYDDGEEEILFAVNNGSRQLDMISSYYDLPFPGSADQRLVLDTSPELYRARHYDIDHLGPGMYKPVVVAGVTFDCCQPVRLLLYTFMRPWEFPAPIALPIPGERVSKI